MPQPRARRRPQPQTTPSREFPATGASVTTVASAAVVAGIYGTEAEAIAGGAALQARVTAELTAREAQTLVRAALLGLRKLSIRRRLELPRAVQGVYSVVRPAATAAEIRQVATREVSREMDFRARQSARVRRRMAKALAVEHPRRRGERVAAVMSQERHYARLRAAAVERRAAGAADARNVLATSPEGAVWHLGPREHHCPGCSYLHGQAFPWEALRAAQMIPPLGPGCGCYLRGVRESWLMDEVAELPTVPSVLAAMPILATARSLGHPHRHDGGVTLAG